MSAIEPPCCQPVRWVAGGIGFCEPNEWDAWENHWWDDNWCYTCGALVDVNYNADVTAQRSCASNRRAKPQRHREHRAG